MGVCRLLSLATAVLVLLLAVHLYSPVPDGLAEPWLARTFIAAFRFAKLVAATANLLTGIPTVRVVRWQVDVLYKPVFFNQPGLSVEDRSFDGIPVRVYRPDSAGSAAPCVVYFHGGGWSLFSVETYHEVTSNLALKTNAVVISVSFRLAPEHPYPIPFDDCLKATRHILHNGINYGIDSHRVGVAGDGSGANLAAAVALRLSEEDPEYTPALKLQVLIQPALQAFTFDTPSFRQNADYTLGTRSQMIEFWCYYLAVEPSPAVLLSFETNKHISASLRRSIYSVYFQEYKLPGYIKQNYVESSLGEYSLDYDKDVSQSVEAKVIDPFVSPLLAEDVSRLPQTYILVAEYDVLRDDGLFYASRLSNGNVSVRVDYIHDQTQGFLAPGADVWFLKSEKSSEVWNIIYLYLKQTL
ncbi:unnamed protein product [Candidula unifasciata]|uniref:Alpha/beta hydrolase fold-3 domain-containing protein n=1 Tax=Candidula unifasciata TaxID=100452 RepID=A0A8S3YP55_9EUPU|nr:unnamed protein product [Candidula unifasciata]